MDAVRLRKLLAEVPFQKAIGIVEMISRTPEQHRIHDARQKSLRDQDWILEGTHEAAIKEGRQEGIELGIQRGDRRGKIHLLQQLLGEPLTSDEALGRLELAEMDTMITALLSRVPKSRDVGTR